MTGHGGLRFRFTGTSSLGAIALLPVAMQAGDDPVKSRQSI